MNQNNIVKSKLITEDMFYRLEKLTLKRIYGFRETYCKECRENNIIKPQRKISRAAHCKDSKQIK